MVEIEGIITSLKLLKQEAITEAEYEILIAISVGAYSRDAPT